MAERVRLDAKRSKGFQKGEPRPASSGRRRGTPNRTTTLLRHAVLLAAQEIGSDRKGTGGLVGYCRWLGMKHPELFTSLLLKVLPLQLSVDGPPVRVELSREELAERLRERGLPTHGLFASPAGTLLDTTDPASAGVGTDTRH